MASEEDEGRGRLRQAKDELRELGMGPAARGEMREKDVMKQTTPKSVEKASSRTVFCAFRLVFLDVVRTLVSALLSRSVGEGGMKRVLFVAFVLARWRSAARDTRVFALLGKAQTVPPLTAVTWHESSSAI